MPNLSRSSFSTNSNLQFKKNLIVSYIIIYGQYKKVLALHKNFDVLILFKESLIFSKTNSLACITKVAAGTMSFTILYKMKVIKQ